MTTAGILKKMIDYSAGNHHDIQHFMRVYAYAELIGRCEGLDAETQTTLEIAAIVHDIACPLCRKKYGSANGKLQEQEGPALARELLADCGLPSAQLERVCYLVGHHHTLTNIDGMDYQILIEADYLVNSDDENASESAIWAMLKKSYQTKTGIALLKSIHQLHEWKEEKTSESS